MKLNTPTKSTNTTHEGTPAKRLTPEQELRRTVSACLLWEDGFYEGGKSTVQRIAELVPKIAADKVADLAIAARHRMKLRHVPLLLCRELARLGRLKAAMLMECIMRPDELTEFMAIYWKDGKTPLSAQTKKGLAGAFGKFNEYQLAKYNQDGQIKLRDVLFLCHAKPASPEQDALWKRLIANQLVTPDTWEVSLSAGRDKRETWIRLLTEKKLGALALLRNLRNMHTANVPLEVIRTALQAADASWVLPFRFVSAAKYAPVLEPELEMLMFSALQQTPKLPGKTAIVVDTSPSMWMAKVSAKSEMDRFEAAAALAILAKEICQETQIYAFNEKGYRVPPRNGFALRDALANTKGNWSCGGAAVAMANLDGYDRIIVLTDGQWHFSSVRSSTIDQEGDSKVVSPSPLTDKAYMINVATDKNGVGYGKWTSIDGWSEAVLDFIRDSEMQAQ